MKIAILITNTREVSGGFMKHLMELVKRWQQNAQVAQLEIFVLEHIFPDLPQFDGPIRRVPSNDRLRAFRQMAGLVEAGGFDVAFNTAARPVSLSRVPLVVLVQNIEPIQKPTYPMPLLWRLRLWALRRENSIACRKATRVLAVSNHVRDEVSCRFYLGAERIDVAYHGFDAAEASAKTRKPALNISSGEFVFSAGGIVPYRGYEDIIRAIAYIRSDGGDAPCAILAGSGNSLSKSYERSLRRLSSSLKVSELIVWAGQLQREEMSWCFNNARMFIQTSRAEACPNIVLEAMGHGCSCLSCDHPPMPEFFQDAASYYSTGDIVALASAIKATLNEDAETSEFMKSKALQRAALFSWDKTAELTLDSLNRAISAL